MQRGVAAAPAHALPAAHGRREHLRAWRLGRPRPTAADTASSEGESVERTLCFELVGQLRSSEIVREEYFLVRVHWTNFH